MESTGAAPGIFRTYYTFSYILTFSYDREFLMEINWSGKIVSSAEFVQHRIYPVICLTEIEVAGANGRVGFLTGSS